MVRIDHFLIGVLGVGSVFFYMFVSVTGGSYTMKLRLLNFLYTRHVSFLTLGVVFIDRT